jgi:hypothetical protein
MKSLAPETLFKNEEIFNFEIVYNGRAPNKKPKLLKLRFFVLSA